MEPATPNNLEDLRIPDKYKMTSKGEPFLLHESGSGSNRILIFSTRDNIDLLEKAEHVYMDGTFKTTPKIFYQIYIIHAFLNSVQLPLVYVLLPNKTKETYLRMLQAVKVLAPRILPKSFLIDFEAAVMISIQTVFPHSAIRECFFHFRQAIYKKIQNFGLKHKIRY